MVTDNTHDYGIQLSHHKLAMANYNTYKTLTCGLCTVQYSLTDRRVLNGDVGI